MSRLQWKCFLVGMLGLWPSIWVAATIGHRIYILQFLPVLCVAILLAGTLGIGLVRGVEHFLIRRRGVLMTGRVVHARSSGYTNRAPTYEVDVELPNGHVVNNLVVSRFFGFQPGEPIQLVVDPENPDRAALPSGSKRSDSDF